MNTTETHEPADPTDKFVNTLINLNARIEKCERYCACISEWSERMAKIVKNHEDKINRLQGIPAVEEQVLSVKEDSGQNFY